MINFFKNKNEEKDIANDDKSYSNIAALLIHTAKIDEAYDEKEKDIIKETLIELGAERSNIDKLISQDTGLPVTIADDPLSCVAIGTGRALENEELFSTMLSEY